MSGPFKRLIACTLALAVLACSQDTGQNAVYVVVEPERAEQFLELMASISKENGLTPERGTAIHSPGKALNVLEARGRGLTLWLQNMPLSGEESRILCGEHDAPYPDPAQFYFYVEPRLIGGSQKSANDTAQLIADRLTSLGYLVKPSAVVCGRAALSSQQLAQ